MSKPQEATVPKLYHRAVRLAAALLMDEVLQRVRSDDEEPSIALDLLPPHYGTKIENDIHRWSVAFAAAATKLAAPRPSSASCVAEELAMHAIFSFAADILIDGPEFGFPERIARHQVEEWRARIYDGLFEDTDFLFLYDPALDGIGADADEPLGRALRTVNLAYEEWFLPFPGHDGHPYFEPPGSDDDEIQPRS